MEKTVTPDTSERAAFLAELRSYYAYPTRTPGLDITVQEYAALMEIGRHRAYRILEKQVEAGRLEKFQVVIVGRRTNCYRRVNG